jgi:hypothetical protein
MQSPALGNRRVCAEILLLSNKAGNGIEWKVFVTYDGEHYLVIVYDKMVTVYVERELPESRGITMNWPTHVTGVRASAIECVRRVRFGDTG